MTTNPEDQIEFQGLAIAVGRLAIAVKTLESSLREVTAERDALREKLEEMTTNGH